MRFLLFLILLALLSCSSGGLEVQSEWIVRLPCASTSCPGVRSISAYTDDSGYSLDCDLLQSGEVQVLNLKMFALEGNKIDHGFQMQGAIVANDQFVGGRTCFFEVKEGNFYSGACGIDSPGPAQPCQLSEFQKDGDTIQGKILCRDLPLEVSPEQTASVTDPSSASRPFTFVCKGI